MELEFALLALGADYSRNGALHLFGAGFDVMGVSELPSALPPFSITMRLSKAGVKSQEHHLLRIVGVNPLGERVTLADNVDFILEPPVRDGVIKSIASVSVTVWMSVAKPGKHEFHIGCDGHELKTLDLWIDLTPAQTS